MKLNSRQLTEDLIYRTNKATAAVRRLRSSGEEALHYKSDPERWSALECIEHLNRYGDFYLPEIERSVLAARPGSADFNSGVLGNYFARVMEVRADGSVKKMKSPADKNPLNDELTMTTIDRFLKQEERLVELLRQAARVDLTRTKTAISLTKLIRLRLGDTLRFVVYHIERHVLQAEKAAAGVELVATA